MRCPKCNSRGHRVIETRETTNSVRRRRSCQCGHEWSTWEWGVNEYEMQAVGRALRSVYEASAPFVDGSFSEAPPCPQHAEGRHQ
jgi:transcriptional regulator NrdR family protein